MSKPNIVVIMSEHHQASILGCAGDQHIKTPNLDQLAKDGVRLESCYCSSPLCVPSRSSFLTGRLPSENQVYNNQDSLNGHIPTVAHTLTIEGYETVLSGRMHFWGHDQHHGFEKRLVGDTTPYFLGLKDKLNVYHGLEGAQKQQRKGLIRSGAGDSACLEFDDNVCDSTIEYLQTREDDRPLFMVVGLRSVHPPYISPKDLYDYYYENLPELDDYVADHPALKSFLSNRDAHGVPSDARRRVRAAAYGMIEYTDGIVGKIIESVKETIGENTVFVYTADHGDSLGQNGLYWKANHLDPSVKVPCIVSYGGVFQKNEVIEAPTCLTDITQTIIDVAGAKMLGNMYGKSLVEPLQGKGQVSYNRSIVSQLGTYPRTGDDVSAMIRKGDYKLISYYGYDEKHLFNVKEDPQERNNLYGNSEYDEIVSGLMEELQESWDEELAQKHCEQVYDEVKILQAWAQTTKYDFPKMWQGSAERNYIIGE